MRLAWQAFVMCFTAHTVDRCLFGCGLRLNSKKPITTLAGCARSARGMQKRRGQRQQQGDVESGGASGVRYCSLWGGNMNDKQRMTVSDLAECEAAIAAGYRAEIAIDEWIKGGDKMRNGLDVVTRVRADQTARIRDIVYSRMLGRAVVGQGETFKEGDGGA